MQLPNQKQLAMRDMMQRMLREAQDGNWQELARLDNERRALLDYPGNSDIQSSQKPRPSTAVEKVVSRGSSDTAVSGQNPLIKEIMSLDKQILETVQNARQTLIEQTRGVRAQVSAKKGYETTSTMPAHSYS